MEEKSFSGEKIETITETGEPTEKIVIEGISGVGEEKPLGEKKKKSKRPMILAGILVATALGCGGFCYYQLNQGDSAKKEEVATAKPEPVKISEFRMSGNELSDFDLAFLKMGEADENKIYSPLSMKYALAMLKDAADGETKEQIEDVIGDYKPKSYINSENLALANAMFVNTNFQEKVQKSYTEGIRKNYNAEVIIDDFATPKTANDWVSGKTLGIIDEMFNEAQVNPQLNYMLVNALAIDMNWKNQIQCTADELEDEELDCTYDGSHYSAGYAHEDYSHYVYRVLSGAFGKVAFNGGNEVDAGEIGADVNNYNIIEEIGEKKIRETVLAEYEKWKESEDGKMSIQNGFDDFEIEKYMEELKANYGKVGASTDFKLAANETEKVLVKELKEYDGATLEYIGIMPTEKSLSEYVKDLDAEKTEGIIETAKEITKENFKEGVVTKISGYIPFFKFNQEMDLTKYLPELGIKDVFSDSEADLSAMISGATDTEEDRPYIGVAVHKADIDFSNNGIKAAAATATGGAGGGGGRFEYEWEVPVEEIDMTFDKPFLFLIRNKATKEVWFTGEVNEI